MMKKMKQYESNVISKLEKLKAEEGQFITFKDISDEGSFFPAFRSESKAIRKIQRQILHTKTELAEMEDGPMREENLMIAKRMTEFLVKGSYIIQKGTAPLGIAAPQLGISRAIFACKIKVDGIIDRDDEILVADGPRNVYVAFINPVMETLESSKVVNSSEACLSASNIPWNSFKVKRQNAVIVKGHCFILGTRGNENHEIENFEIKVEGRMAHAIQHEMDHLNGRMYYDLIKEQIKANLFGFKSSYNAL